MRIPPNVYDAESIPDSAKIEIDKLLKTGDLFRYNSQQSPVSMLEKEFANMIGCKNVFDLSLYQENKERYLEKLKKSTQLNDVDLLKFLEGNINADTE